MEQNIQQYETIEAQKAKQHEITVYINDVQHRFPFGMSIIEVR